MRFLVDNALSPLMARYLQKQGYDAVHVRDIGMRNASDVEILQLAREQQRTLISADTDFGYLLAVREDKWPSLTLFRRSDNRPDSLNDVLERNLGRVLDYLQCGAIVVLDDERIRVRLLPIRDD